MNFFMNSEEFARRLCSWQREKGRQNLPWFTSDPYRRWLSEIMLQQTQVSVVRDYFSRFLQAFPTVDDLAEASEEDVMRLWAGLGYYSRARNLHKAAKEIAAAGRFPQTRAAWEKLPGVGSSTAAALASFCNGEVAAVCDGNVKRVLARIFALSAPINQSKTAKLLQQVSRRGVLQSIQTGQSIGLPCEGSGQAQEDGACPRFAVRRDQGGRALGVARAPR